MSLLYSFATVLLPGHIVAITDFLRPSLTTNVGVDLTCPSWLRKQKSMPTTGQPSGPFNHYSLDLFPHLCLSPRPRVITQYSHPGWYTACPSSQCLSR